MGVLTVYVYTYSYEINYFYNSRRAGLYNYSPYGRATSSYSSDADWLILC